MQHFIFLAILGAMALYGYRLLKRDSARALQKVRRTEKERQTGARGTLIKDPRTGVYHLDRD